MIVTKLETQHSLAEFYEDSVLLGLISFAKAYRFCWLINSFLGFDFKMDVDKEIISMKKTRTYYFPVYNHYDNLTNTEHFLYCNKYEGEFLLPEFKHLDFIWIIKGDSDFSDIVPIIKLIPEIQFSVPIKLNQIHNKEHLVF